MGFGHLFVDAASVDSDSYMGDSDYEKDEKDGDEAALAVRRLDASPLGRAYRHVVNRENGYDFFDLFTSKNDPTKLRRRLKAVEAGGSAKHLAERLQRRLEEVERNRTRITEHM